MDVEPRGVKRHVQSDPPLDRLLREDDRVVLVAPGVRGDRDHEVLSQGHFILDVRQEGRGHRRRTQRSLRVAQRGRKVEESGGVRRADGLASHRCLIGVPGTLVALDERDARRGDSEHEAGMDLHEIHVASPLPHHGIVQRNVQRSRFGCVNVADVPIAQHVVHRHHRVPRPIQPLFRQERTENAPFVHVNEDVPVRSLKDRRCKVRDRTGGRLRAHPPHKSGRVTDRTENLAVQKHVVLRRSRPVVLHTFHTQIPVRVLRHRRAAVGDARRQGECLVAAVVCVCVSHTTATDQATGRTLGRFHRTEVSQMRRVLPPSHLQPGSATVGATAAAASPVPRGRAACKPVGCAIAPPAY